MFVSTAGPDCSCIIVTVVKSHAHTFGDWSKWKNDFIQWNSSGIRCFIVVSFCLILLWDLPWKCKQKSMNGSVGFRWYKNSYPQSVLPRDVVHQATPIPQYIGCVDFFPNIMAIFEIGSNHFQNPNTWEQRPRRAWNRESVWIGPINWIYASFPLSKIKKKSPFTFGHIFAHSDHCIISSARREGRKNES